MAKFDAKDSVKTMRTETADAVQNTNQEHEARGLKLHIGDFEGPLDLLVYLIERNEIDIFDIPVASLTQQYMDYLTDIEELDMELASDFLLMGASLLELKSRLMLPREEKEETEDPRDEFVLRLLAYRRCKLIAQELKQRENLYGRVHFRLPESPANLGLEAADPTLLYADESEFQSLRWKKAVTALAARNSARFQDISEKMDYIVSREQLNLKLWIRNLWNRLVKAVSLSFDSLFPRKEGKQQRLTGFLAVLELLKQNRITVKQEVAFSDIEITKRESEDPLDDR